MSTSPREHRERLQRELDAVAEELKSKGKALPERGSAVSALLTHAGVNEERHAVDHHLRRRYERRRRLLRRYGTCRPNSAWAVFPSIYPITFSESAKAAAALYFESRDQANKLMGWHLAPERARGPHGRPKQIVSVPGYEQSRPVPVARQKAGATVQAFTGKPFHKFFTVDDAGGEPESDSDPAHTNAIESADLQLIECVLGQDWQFGAIASYVQEVGASRGIRRSGPLHTLLSALQELEEEVYKVSPPLSAAALRDFWSSYEVHRFLYDRAVVLCRKFDLGSIRASLALIRGRIVAYIQKALMTDARHSAEPEAALSSGDDVKPKAKMSKADQKLLELIGPNVICACTNRALFDQYGRNWKNNGRKQKNDYPAFRSRLNRIRSACGLPTSEEVLRAVKARTLSRPTDKASRRGKFLSEKLT